ncbi:hypothetical protein Bbelb_141070 [Branchiostoma belcheri]|nr:hypothetical protein Bbelb_141070 [Branchiostoma belcheri]
MEEEKEMLVQGQEHTAHSDLREAGRVAVRARGCSEAVTGAAVCGQVNINKTATGISFSMTCHLPSQTHTEPTCTTLTTYRNVRGLTPPDVRGATCQQQSSQPDINLIQGGI